MTKGTLIAAMNMAQVAADEFDDWYDNEHVPERQRVPGFLVCQRWIGAEDEKISVATYDLDSVEVLRSPLYLAIGGENLSPWSKRITSRVERLMRFEGDQILPGDQVAPDNAGGLLLNAMNIAPALEAEFNEWYDKEHIPGARRRPRRPERAPVPRHEREPEVRRPLPPRHARGAGVGGVEGGAAERLDEPSATAFPRSPAPRMPPLRPRRPALIAVGQADTGRHHHDDLATRTREPAARLAAGARAPIPRHRRRGRTYLGRRSHLAPDDDGPAFRRIEDDTADLRPGRRPLPRRGLAGRRAGASELVREPRRAARGARCR